MVICLGNFLVIYEKKKVENCLLLFCSSISVNNSNEFTFFNIRKFPEKKISFFFEFSALTSV